MKKITNKVLLLAILIPVLSYANTNGADLDKIGTCTTPTQTAMKERIINWFHNYETWNIAELYSKVHPDYISWHASRAFQAAATPPENRSSLPFGNGTYNKSGFIENLAKIAFRYGMDSYLVKIERIDCVGEDSAVVSSVFSGTALIRDPATGDALYKYEMKDIPTRFTIVEKEGLVYRYIVDLADATSVNLAIEMGKLLKKPPNVTPGEFKALRYEDLLKNFQDQIHSN